jgi:hypothetical protein
MTDAWQGLTLDEIRTRMAAAGIEIAEDRLELVRGLVNMGLGPIRAADLHGLQDVEPALRFAKAVARPEAHP